MPLRVDRPGMQALFTEGLAEAAPPEEAASPWQERPWSGKEGFQFSEAGRLAQIPGEVLAETRPPVPQQLFPEEFGYPQEQPTIEEVLDISRWTPQIRSWVSPWMRSPERADYDAQIQSGPTPAMSVSPFG